MILPPTPPEQWYVEESLVSTWLSFRRYRHQAKQQDFFLPNGLSRLVFLRWWIVVCPLSESFPLINIVDVEKRPQNASLGSQIALSRQLNILAINLFDNLSSTLQQSMTQKNQKFSCYSPTWDQKYLRIDNLCIRTEPRVRNSSVCTL